MNKFLITIFLFIVSCGSSSSKPDFRIALDPEWYGLEMPERSLSIQAFSIEIFQAIAKEKKMKIVLYDQNWDALIYGLIEEKYEGILSTLQPYLFYQKTYDFSDIYLPIGPTLVIPTTFSIKSLDEMNNKEIAIQRDSNAALVLERYPDIIQRTYETISSALSDVANGVVDGAIVDILTAHSYCSNLYQGRLKIAFPPLTQEGLKLVTLHNTSSGLIHTFNEGLKELKENGTYATLVKKWNLGE